MVTYRFPNERARRRVPWGRRFDSSRSRSLRSATPSWSTASSGHGHEAAVRDFQQRTGLAVDGIADPDTQVALGM